jgi:rRNA maturation endonuclease Nob1
MSIRCILLVLALPLLMGSEVYRYVDSNGVVTYAQQLPYGVQGERITTVAGAPTKAAPAVATVPEKPAEPVLSPQQQAMLDKLKAADQARKDEIATIREANCKRSQEVLMRLLEHGRIRVKEPNGQEVRMTEEERERRIAEAQTGIVANCTPAEEAAASEPSVANASG